MNEYKFQLAYVYTDDYPNGYASAVFDFTITAESEEKAREQATEKLERCRLDRYNDIVPVIAVHPVTVETSDDVIRSIIKRSHDEYVAAEREQARIRWETAHPSN
jgi:hypothetical protein